MLELAFGYFSGNSYSTTGIEISRFHAWLSYALLKKNTHLCGIQVIGNREIEKR